jgi:hypothetical protein
MAATEGQRPRKEARSALDPSGVLAAPRQPPADSGEDPAHHAKRHRQDAARSVHGQSLPRAAWFVPFVASAGLSHV